MISSRLVGFFFGFGLVFGVGGELSAANLSAQPHL